MTDEPIVVSYSRVSLWTQCSQKWKYRYVDQLPEPDGKPTIVGRSVHESIKKWHDGGFTIKEAEDLAGSIYDLSNLDPLVEKDPLERGDVINEVGRLFAAWLGSSPLKVVSSEREVIIPLKDPLTGKVHDNVLVKGYIDADIADDHIAEYKTSRRTWTPDRFLHETQGNFYALLKDVPALRVTYDIIVSKKIPEVQRIEVEKKPQLAYKLIQRYLAAIQTGDYYPSRGLQCGWCPYSDTCVKQEG